jgi:hypothetical protein
MYRPLLRHTHAVLHSRIVNDVLRLSLGMRIQFLANRANAALSTFDLRYLLWYGSAAGPNVPRLRRSVLEFALMVTESESEQLGGGCK